MLNIAQGLDTEIFDIVVTRRCHNVDSVIGNFPLTVTKNHKKHKHHNRHKKHKKHRRGQEA